MPCDHKSDRGGDKRTRTVDPLLAKQVLYQLSYTPERRLSQKTKKAFKIKQRFRPITDRDNQMNYFKKLLHRKEVIQPHLPIRLPCYDFTPVANPTLGSVLPKVRQLTLGITGSHGVTGGVYKARERIHRDMLIRDY